MVMTTGIAYAGGGVISGPSTGDSVRESTIGNLPSSPPSGTIRIATNGSSATDCTSGSGSTRVFCGFDGTVWSALGSGQVALLTGADGDSSTSQSDSGLEFVSGSLALLRGCADNQIMKWDETADDWNCEADSGATAVTLDASFDVGKQIDGANSEANAFRVGDGTIEWCFYSDGSDAIGEACVDADSTTRIQTNFNWQLYDVEGDRNFELVNPDAASTNLMWTYPTAAVRPVKSIVWMAAAMTADGTNCADPTEFTMDSGPEMWGFSCGDSNSSIFYGSVIMPDAWDAGVVDFELTLFHVTTETITFAGDFGCKTAGDSQDFDGATWSASPVAADVGITTANDMEYGTAADVTCSGTAAAGDILVWRYVVDATNFSTNAANAKVIAVKMEYAVDSRSDGD